MQISLVLLVVSVGLLLPIQASINARLIKELGSPLLSGFVNFAVGMVAIALIALALRTRLPAGPVSIPWWAWTGGLCGATFVIASAFAVGKIPSALLVGGLILGNLTAAVLCDHFGLFSLPVRPLTWERGLGILLLLSGVFVIARAR